MKNIAYFDYAATSFRKPRCAYKAAMRDYVRFGIGHGRGSSPQADKCKEIVDSTRQALKDMVSATLLSCRM